MKSIFGEILKNDKDSFFLQESSLYHALNDYHYHPEIELIYILKGAGSFLINEKLGHIVDGTMIMIGSNVPHMFKFDSFSYSNPLWKQGQSPNPIQLITLHFDPKLFGDAFLDLPENYLIKLIFVDCLRGLLIHPENHEEIFDKLQILTKAPKYDQLPVLLRLFTSIGLFTKNAFITAETDDHIFNKIDEQRLTKIYLYTLNNFTKTIRLKDIAAIIYMSPNAFCRYFKSLTQKSYFEFLLEVKIDHACKLLKETDDSMVNICYESGFSNHSNFNRHFKAITGFTPLEYRKKVQH